jgi:hypothetical protein
MFQILSIFHGHYWSYCSHSEAPRLPSVSHSSIFKKLSLRRCSKVANSVCSDFGIIKKHINTLRFHIIFSFISQGVLTNYLCTCVCFVHVLVTVRYLCMLCCFCYGQPGNSFSGLMNRIRTWNLTYHYECLIWFKIQSLPYCWSSSSYSTSQRVFYA